MRSKPLFSALCTSVFIAAGLSAAGLSAAGLSAADPVTELPLTEVILYSSGVGAFAHQGRISGNTLVRFRMSKKQLNDLLKSLYITATDEGVSVRSVTYPTELPLRSLLEGYRINVTNITSLADILRQIPGSELTLGIAGVSTPVKGKLIAVETKKITVQGNPGRTESVEYAVMLTDKGFQRFAVAELTSIIPADKALLAEMTRALTLLAGHKNLSARPLDLNLTAKKASEVRVAYVIEAPVWKASYRLELDGKSKEKANLQGWAMVENPTSTEWKNVTLSLISGRPASFIQDLYTSLYLPRPEVGRELYERNSFEGNSVMAAKAPRRMGKTKGNKLYTMGISSVDCDGMVTGAGAPEFRRVGGDTSAKTSVMGELYSYKIAKPVTLGSRQSAMLELVQTQISAEKLSFYSMRDRAERPLNAVLIKNTSPLLLPQGPVTVFDGKNYGGDASLSDLPSGQEQILRYGVDLEVTAIPSSADYTMGRISDLAIDRSMIKYSARQTIRYKCIFENKSKKDKTILFEVPRSDSEKIVNGMKPVSETAGSCRFKISVKAGKTVTAEVKFERPVVQSYSVNADSFFSGYAFTARNADLSPESKAVVKKLMVYSSKMKDIRQELKTAEEKIRDLAAKHDRTRSSLNTANLSAELRTRLSKRLTETDEALDKQYQVKDAKKAELEKIRKEFSEYLSGTKK